MSDLDVKQVRWLAGRNDVTLIRLRDADLSAARNAGLEPASARCVLFLDADDPVDVDELLWLAESSAPEVLDVVYVPMTRFADPDPAAPHLPASASTRMRRSTETLPGSTFLLRELLANRYSPVTGGYLFRGEWLLGLGLRFTPGFLHKDHAFVAAAVAQAEWVVEGGTTACFKREREGSITRTMSDRDRIAGYARAVEGPRAVGS